jgi:uncharacterized C2H2 Zn-finger protein
MVKAEKIIGRGGRVLYRCPLCGHVFTNQKAFTKHIQKSHVKNETKRED